MNMSAVHSLFASGASNANIKLRPAVRRHRDGLWRQAGRHSVSIPSLHHHRRPQGNICNAAGWVVVVGWSTSGGMNDSGTFWDSRRANRLNRDPSQSASGLKQVRSVVPSRTWSAVPRRANNQYTVMHCAEERRGYQLTTIVWLTDRADRRRFSSAKNWSVIEDSVCLISRGRKQRPNDDV